MAESSCLELRDVGLAFGGLRVLQGLSFATRDAELLCLIGPNGAGKTSVLNCVCGIYRPSAGRIAFEGRELTALAPHAIARLGLARTFQHGELMPHLSVIENLLVARHTRFTTNLIAEALFTRRVRDEEIVHRRAVEEVLDFTELWRFRHEHVGGLPLASRRSSGSRAPWRCSPN